MDTRRIVKIFLASPMDLQEERQRVFRIVERINGTIGKNLNCCYEILSWERDVLPDKGDDAQHVVNRQISMEYDVFVCLFKERLGTPTARSVSGTVEEYERALTYKCANPALKFMCYFIGQSDDAAQLAAFKKKMHADGVLYSDIPDPNTFESTLYTHFVQLLLQIAKSGVTPKTATGTQDSVAIAFVSPDDRVLLVRRSESTSYCPGFWQLPGGKQEPDETPVQTALREAEEELQISLDEELLRQLHVYDTHFKNDRSRPMNVYLYLYPLAADTPLVLNRENDTYEWLPLHKLDLSGKQLLGIHKELLKAVWNEQSVLGVLDKLLTHCKQSDQDVLPPALPGVRPERLHSTYALLTLLGITELKDRVCFASSYAPKLLEALVYAYKSGAALFHDKDHDPMQDCQLPISEYGVLRSRRENALFSHEALLSVLSCSIQLPHSVRNISNVLIFGTHNDQLYLLLRWDIFSKKYQIFASGADHNESFDSLAMANKTIRKRLAPDAERFFDLLKMKSFTTYHFAAGSVDNDPILRKYIIHAVNGVVRKQYREDLLELVRLANTTTMTVLEYGLNLSRQDLKGLNYFSWCKLEDLLKDRTHYQGNAVRGIDELLSNIGKTEFLLFSKNAVALTEADICPLPEALL